MGNIEISEAIDKPWWTKLSAKNFTIKSAWEALRSRSIPSDDFTKLWRA